MPTPMQRLSSREALVETFLKTASAIADVEGAWRGKAAGAFVLGSDHGVPLSGAGPLIAQVWGAPA